MKQNNDKLENPPFNTENSLTCTKQIKRRKRLHPFIRLFIIATWGSALAITVYYILNKIGK
ncbi:hypothetical protein S225a_08510 [Candidatus Brocadiaceae bacterium S225]|nr:hypothetical protein S225a_08510 [Candidatus Brocadiaceae bacterium S225]